MVLAEFDDLALNLGNSSGVTSVSAVDELGSDENHISSAPSVRLLLVLRSVIFILHLFLDVDNFAPAGGGSDEVVHLEEGLLESLLVVLAQVVLVLLEFFAEVAFDEGGDFSAWVRGELPPWPSKTAKRQFLLSERGTLVM
jgi:hypothetical protein